MTVQLDAKARERILRLGWERRLALEGMPAELPALPSGVRRSQPHGGKGEAQALARDVATEYFARATDHLHRREVWRALPEVEWRAWGLHCLGWTEREVAAGLAIHASRVHRILARHRKLAGCDV